MRSESILKRYVLTGRNITETDDILTWGRFLQEKKRFIEQDTLRNGVCVSTVFLGVDHGHGDGAPVLFETMVFDVNKDVVFTERYCTYEQAETGHQILLEKYKDYERHGVDARRD